MSVPTTVWLWVHNTNADMELDVFTPRSKEKYGIGRFSTPTVCSNLPMQNCPGGLGCYSTRGQKWVNNGSQHPKEPTGRLGPKSTERAVA